METNTEKRKAYKRAYYIKHKEQFSEYKKKYYREHKDEIRAYSREYYQKNKDERNKKQREYYKEHKQHYKELSRERRIRDKNKRDGASEIDLKVKTLLDNTEAFGELLNSVLSEGSRIYGENLLKLICLRDILSLSVGVINIFLKHIAQSEASDD